MSDWNGADMIRVTPPVQFPQADGRTVIFASKAGAPSNPDRYHNLKAHPRVQVEVGTETYPVDVAEARGAERTEIWEGVKAAMPGFAEYERRTDRTIPVPVLTRVQRPFAGVDAAAEQFERVDAACTAIGRDDAEIAARARTMGREVDELRTGGLTGTQAEVVDRIGTRRGWAGITRLYPQLTDLADLDQIDLIAAQLQGPA